MGFKNIRSLIKALKQLGYNVDYYFDQMNNKYIIAKVNKLTIEFNIIKMEVPKGTYDVRVYINEKYQIDKSFRFTSLSEAYQYVYDLLSKEVTT